MEWTWSTSRSYSKSGYLQRLRRVEQPVRLAVILMTSFYYENRDIPDMTTYKATRMAFDSLLYPYRDPEKMF